MRRKELPAAFQGVVQLQSTLMVLTLTFKQSYSEEALEITEDFEEQLGTYSGYSS